MVLENHMLIGKNRKRVKYNQKQGISHIFYIFKYYWKKNTLMLNLTSLFLSRYTSLKFSVCFLKQNQPIILLLKLIYEKCSAKDKQIKTRLVQKSSIINLYLRPKERKRKNCLDQHIKRIKDTYDVYFITISYNIYFTNGCVFQNKLYVLTILTILRKHLY